ncbi:hypothetical protein HID58_058039, partial [Brassica napus]
MQLLTCRTYIHKEGLRQQQLFHCITSTTFYLILLTSGVLDNLKDYTVKALVNAVDHLGTVASKLTDLFDQQSSDISTMELRASCVSQQLLTCRTYIDKEGLRQQQLLAVIPLHHKHYILPNSVNKR